MRQIIRDRRLTPEEVAKYRLIRQQVEAELPELVARHHERMKIRQERRMALDQSVIQNAESVIKALLNQAQERERWLEAYERAGHVPLVVEINKGDFILCSRYEVNPMNGFVTVQTKDGSVCPVQHTKWWTIEEARDRGIEARADE